SGPRSPRIWPSSWRGRKTRSRAATSRRRAASPSRRRACIPTIPPCTCYSAASRSPPDAAPMPSRSCAARSGSIRSPWPRTGCSATRSRPPAGSARPSSSGTNGNGSPHAQRRSWRSSTRCAAPRRRRRPSRGRGRMPDAIKTLSSQLAQDPDSLVFLRLGELLRQKGQLDTAHRVALTGLERHPHLPDAHDLYARILADKHDYERAFDEWDMALRIAPDHVGALKGLAFLYFKVGDVQQAAAHLEAAQRAAPDDPGVAHGQAARPGALDGTRGGRDPRPRASRSAHERRAAPRGARPRGPDGTAGDHRAARRARGAPLAGGARVTAPAAAYGEALDLIT